jgi:peptidoglycan DL-endopeptidase CwlO
MVLIVKHRHRPISKRVNSIKSVALVFSLASVFLIGASPVQAQALDNPKPSALFTEPTTVSPLQENEIKLEKLKVEFKTQEQRIEEKKDDVQKAQEEAESALKLKSDTASTVEGLKAQIADLQARLAEKKRLEALRIVPKGGYASNAGGNLYALGNCTWWVKSKRPDIPNNLGNANTWYANAAAAGYKVGSMAKTGAIGTTTAGWAGHVVYVEKWLGNGQILISEMNFAGLYSTRERIADESEFTYIYEL